MGSVKPRVPRFWTAQRDIHRVQKLENLSDAHACRNGHPSELRSLWIESDVQGVAREMYGEGLILIAGWPHARMRSIDISLTATFTNHHTNIIWYSYIKSRSSIRVFNLCKNAKHLSDVMLIRCSLQSHDNVTSTL